MTKVLDLNILLFHQFPLFLPIFSIFILQGSDLFRQMFHLHFQLLYSTILLLLNGIFIILLLLFSKIIISIHIVRSSQLLYRGLDGVLFLNTSEIAMPIFSLIISFFLELLQFQFLNL